MAVKELLDHNQRAGRTGSGTRALDQAALAEHGTLCCTRSRGGAAIELRRNGWFERRETVRRGAGQRGDAERTSELRDARERLAAEAERVQSCAELLEVRQLTGRPARADQWFRLIANTVYRFILPGSTSSIYGVCYIQGRSYHWGLGGPRPPHQSVWPPHQ